jgi:hypothetical protein
VRRCVDVGIQILQVLAQQADLERAARPKP